MGLGPWGGVVIDWLNQGLSMALALGTCFD